MSESEEMNENGSEHFDELLGEGESPQQVFEVRKDFPARVLFQKYRDQEALSIPYGVIGAVRYYGTAIYIAVGEGVITIRGHRLRPLFDALHAQQVAEVREQSNDAFAIAENVVDEMATVVDSIEWDAVLAPKGS